jgi:GT2 family glycosyltransferase
MNNPRVTIIILSFGEHETTLACLDSLTQLSSQPATIIVCDNNSSKSTWQAVLEWGTKQYGKENMAILDNGFTDQPSEPVKFVFIQNGANVGFAQGNNPGIRYGLASGSDYIWLLNNDTIVHPEALEQLLCCAAKDQSNIIGSTIVFNDDQATVQCAGGSTYNPATTIFKPAMGGTTLEEAAKPSNNPKQLDYVYGASLFVHQEVFRKCGLLNEDYFLFYEEIDLCRRALKAGFTIGWCRESIVYHKVSQSVGRPDSGDRKKIAFANYHENLSTLLFTRRFYPLLLPVSMLFRFFGKLAIISKRGEFYLVKPLLDAYRDFFMGRNQRDKYKG